MRKTMKVTGQVTAAERKSQKVKSSVLPVSSQCPPSVFLQSQNRLSPHFLGSLSTSWSVLMVSIQYSMGTLLG